MLAGNNSGNSGTPGGPNTGLLGAGVLVGNSSGNGGLIGAAVLAGNINSGNSGLDDGNGAVGGTGLLGAGVLVGDNSGNGGLIGGAVLAGNNSGNSGTGLTSAGGGGLLGAGVLVGSNSGNGGQIGGAVLAGANSGNSASNGVLGAGVLTGANSGNGGVIGGAVLTGANSGNGGLTGVGVLTGNTTDWAAHRPGLINVSSLLGGQPEPCADADYHNNNRIGVPRPGCQPERRSPIVAKAPPAAAAGQQVPRSGGGSCGSPGTEGGKVRNVKFEDVHFAFDKYALTGLRRDQPGSATSTRSIGCRMSTRTCWWTWRVTPTRSVRRPTTWRCPSVARIRCVTTSSTQVSSRVASTPSRTA